MAVEAPYIVYAPDTFPELAEHDLHAACTSCGHVFRYGDHIYGVFSGPGEVRATCGFCFVGEPCWRAHVHRPNIDHQT